MICQLRGRLGSTGILRMTRWFQGESWRQTIHKRRNALSDQQDLWYTWFSIINTLTLTLTQLISDNNNKVI